MKQWVRANTVPILWELLYIAGMVRFPQYGLYMNTAFFLGVIIWFRHDFSLKELRRQWGSGAFWKAVAATLLGLLAGFAGSVLLSARVFGGVEDGLFKMPVHGWGDLLLFACNTILLPPLAQELFHRQSLIRGATPGALVLTSIISVLLYSAEHGIGLAGMAETVCLAIPFTISYGKTKNVYVVMTAHFLLNLVGNLPDIVMGACRMMNR